MIATIRISGVIRGLILSLLVAAPVYGYKNYLSWEWKPMSAEDDERFSDRYIQKLDYERATNYPDMGVVVNECVSDWGSFAENTVLRPDHATRSGFAMRCDRIKAYDGSEIYGWTYVPNEP